MKIKPCGTQRRSNQALDRSSSYTRAGGEIPYYMYILINLSIFLFIYLFIYQEPTDIPSRKKNEVGVCQRLVCQKREFAVRSSSCEV